MARKPTASKVPAAAARDGAAGEGRKDKARKTTAGDVRAAKARADLQVERNRYTLERARAKAIKRITGVADRSDRNRGGGGGGWRDRDAESRENGPGGIGGPLAFSGSYRSSRTSRTRKQLGGGGVGGRIQVGSADANLDEATLDYLRRDSQDLFRNSDVAKMVVGRRVTTQVGGGSSVKPKTSNKAFNDAVERLWKAYWNTKGVDPETGVHGVDARGLVAGAAFERLVRQQVYVDGDAAPIWLDDGTVQVIDAARIVSKYGGGAAGMAQGDDWSRGAGGGESCGVLCDKRGRITGIRVADYGFGGSGIERPTKVLPASVVMWLVNAKGRSGGINQTRGEPLLSCIYDRIIELDRFIAATGLGAYIAACYVTYTKTASPTQVAAQLAGQPVTVANGDGTSTSVRELVTEPGVHWNLRPGEEAGSLCPNQPTGQFAPFVQACLQLIFAFADMPMLVGMFDPTGVNLSLMRGLVELAGQETEAEQEDWKATFLSPNYVNRVAMWMREGKLTGAPADWSAHEWTCAPLPNLDLEGAVRAWKLAVDAGMATRQMATASMWGKSSEEIVTERVAEQKLEEKLGLKVLDMPGQQVADAAARGEGPAKKPEPGAPPDKK